MSRAIILNGTSSAGKSSIARAIQQRSPTPFLSASLDMFVDMFWWPAIDSAAERAECHRVGVGNFHAFLPILAAQRFPVVIDHVFERQEWHRSCVEALTGVPAYIVGVHCPLDVLEQRERDRGDRRIGLARMQFERVHQWAKYDLVVDTSRTTPDECAAAILKFVDESKEPGR